MSSEDQSDKTPQETGKPGYGSKWKRLLLIYLVAAVVIYGLIYLIFLRDGSGGFSY